MQSWSEQTNKITHVPGILYHWRRVAGSLATSSGAKLEIGRKQAAAVSAHLARVGIPANAEPHPNLPHRATLKPHSRVHFPKLSIIVPTKDAPDLIGPCLDSIFTKTSYPDFEVIVVDNETTDLRAKEILAHHPITLVSFNEPFNFSRANNLGVEVARGEYVVLLNNDTEVIDPNWLQALVFYLELPLVGAVGPILLYRDMSIQHAGVAIGIRGSADHVMRGFPADSDGYAGSLACARVVMAITAACMMVRRSTYQDLGGMREIYATIYQDVDFCLRMRRAGFSILCTPSTRLFHHESATRGEWYDHLDRALFRDAWQEVIAGGDPFHNTRVPGYYY